MNSPEDSLNTLVIGKFIPLQKGDKTLTISNFSDLNTLPISPGSLITLAGNVTHVSAKRGPDADIHFNLSATPDAGGYWLVGRDGGVFPFGNAQNFGSTGNLDLVKPIVGIAATSGG